MLDTSRWCKDHSVINFLVAPCGNSGFILSLLTMAWKILRNFQTVSMIRFGNSQGISFYLSIGNLCIAYIPGLESKVKVLNIKAHLLIRSVSIFLLRDSIFYCAKTKILTHYSLPNGKYGFNSHALDPDVLTCD